MKALLTNTVALNGGDAAMMVAAHALLRRRFGPRTEVVVQDDRGEVAARYYPDLRFRPRLLRHVGERVAGRAERILVAGRARGVPLPVSAHARQTLEDWQTYDLFLSTGGTYLVDHYDLRPRGLELDLMSRAGPPLVFLTQTIGPLRKAVHRRALGPAFSRARAVFTRDETSRAEAIALGAKATACHVAPDLAFSLATPDRLEAARTRRMPAEGLQVGISVRAWRHFKRGLEGRESFEAAIAELASHVVTRLQGRVIFVSTCQGIPEYWAQDAEVAARIRRRLPESVAGGVHIDDGFAPPEARIAQLSTLDLLVSTRLHAGILALVGGTPVVPIEYERKTTDVFDAIGQSEWVRSIDDLDGSRLIETVDRFLHRIDEQRSEVFERVAEVSRRAGSILDGLDLEGGP